MDGDTIAIIVLSSLTAFLSFLSLVIAAYSLHVRLEPKRTRRREHDELSEFWEQLRYNRRLCVFKGCAELASASLEYKKDTDDEPNFRPLQPIFTALEWQGYSKLSMYFCVDHLAHTARAHIERTEVHLKKRLVFLYNDQEKEQDPQQVREATPDFPSVSDESDHTQASIYNSNLSIKCVQCGAGALGTIKMLNYSGDVKFELLTKLLKYCPRDGGVLVLYGNNDTLEDLVELSRGNSRQKCTMKGCDQEANQALRGWIPAESGGNKAEDWSLCQRHYKTSGFPTQCNVKGCDQEAQLAIPVSGPPGGPGTFFCMCIIHVRDWESKMGTEVRSA